MSFHARDNFKAGPISQVPVSWFNGVANFLNNLCGGLGIRVMRDATPPQIALDVDVAKKALAIPSVCPNDVCQADSTGDTTSEVAARAPKAVEQIAMNANTGAAETETDSQKIARIGTSGLVARADHKHRDPKLHNSRQILSVNTTGNNVKMFEVVADSNVVSTLKFYPPKFDCGGRYIGLSDTAVELCKFYTVAD